MKGKLYVVAGPSGVGKGTVCKELLRQRPQLGFSVSNITRDARDYEIDGVHYNFMSEAEFLAKRDAGELLEFSRHNKGVWYGTPLKPVMDRIMAGQSVLLEIDDNGARQVIAKYPEAITVFVLPPDKKTLIRRLVYRCSDNLEQLIPRVQKMPGEFAAARDYDYLVLNDDVDASIRDMIDLYDGVYETPKALYELLDRLVDEFADVDNTMDMLKSYYAEAHADETED
ncbi:MAG: guanylate kinase [Clostridia bacterium]|nr:guanylate kinase [Clostridia bacterium]